MSAFIYFQTEQPLSSVLDGLAEHLELTVDPSWPGLESDEFDLSLKANDDASSGVDPEAERDRYWQLEYYALVSLEETLDEARQVVIVRRVLEWFWSRGIPAITESEYDDQLPFGGGNEPTAIPWATP